MFWPFFPLCWVDCDNAKRLLKRLSSRVSVTFAYFKFLNNICFCLCLSSICLARFLIACKLVGLLIMTRTSLI